MTCSDRCESQLLRGDDFYNYNLAQNRLDINMHREISDRRSSAVGTIVHT